METYAGPSLVWQASGFNTPELCRWGLAGRLFFKAPRSFVILCFLLMLVISAGCAHPTGNLPAISGKPPAPSLDIAKLKERSDFWRNYQCKCRLRVDSKTSKFSSRAIVFVEGPNFVRFETFTPLGQTVALYVFNETGPALLIPSEKTIYTAQRPETLVRQFMGVNLPVDLFRYALAASVPTEQFEHIESRSEADGWGLISNSGGNHFEWRLNADSLDLGSILVSGGEFNGRVSYDPPVGIKKEAVPDKIRISSSEWNMEIVVEELKPAPPFQPSIFYMPNLPDVRRVDLDNLK
ncbi:MAG: lipoprotein insertase outer membrane protein LolB [Syntrophobacteraceae bacterium]